MKKQAPKENFTDLAADLAMTIADVLDHPDCPNDLRNALCETIDEVQNAIGPTCSELLRALAGLAKARDRETRAEAEKTFIANPSARAVAVNGAS